MNLLRSPGSRPLVIGHRGAAAVAPENTLAALRAAIDAGADIVEFDVGPDLRLAHSAHERPAEQISLDDALEFLREHDLGVQLDAKGPGYEQELVDAARGQGMTGFEIVRKVELPLALPTIFGGIRLSSVNVLATAIIAPLAGYETLGTPILSLNVYGFSGAIGAAIVVALLTLAADAGFAGVQRWTTPTGLKVVKGDRRRLRFRPTP